MEIVFLIIEALAACIFLGMLFSSFSWPLLAFILILVLLILKNIMVIRGKRSDSKTSEAVTDTAKTEEKPEEASVLIRETLIPEPSSESVNKVLLSEKNASEKDCTKKGLETSSFHGSLIESCKEDVWPGVKHPFVLAQGLGKNKVDAFFSLLVPEANYFHDIKWILGKEYPWANDRWPGCFTEVDSSDEQLTIRTKEYFYIETPGSIEIKYQAKTGMALNKYIEEKKMFCRISRAETSDGEAYGNDKEGKAFFSRYYQTETIKDLFGMKGVFQITRFSFSGMPAFKDDIWDMVSREPLFELPYKKEKIRVYSCVEPNDQFLKESYIDNCHLKVGFSGFWYVLDDIKRAEISKDEKDADIRKIRKYMNPGKVFFLSELCNKEPRKQEDLELSLDEDKEACLLELANAFFCPNVSPLLNASDDLEADRRKAMLRIYRFISSLDILRYNSFFSNTTVTKQDHLEYLYWSHTSPCYDGGCYGDDTTNYWIRTVFHPKEEWEDLLLYAATSEKMRSFCTKGSLEQGDCPCFFGRYGEMFLYEPFGLKGVLEIKSYI